MEQLPTNPKIPINAIQTQLQRKYELQISKMKAFRAKTKAFNMLRGDYVKQYAMLRDYISELKSCNPGTTVNLDVNCGEDVDDSTRVFKRIYVCLGALKEGFRAGGRDLLGLDGAFMKGPYPGQILTVVGLDGNNGIYPLAYAIVEAETKDSSTWFLENLGDDLDMGRNSNFTFITDRQKGLLPALNDVFPCAEHKYCVRHIHSNMKKKWGVVAYKEQLWKCASALTIPHFEVAIEGMRQLSEDAYGWLSKIPPNGWSRAYMTDRAHSDVLLNNMCEVFNRQLVDGRDKPIITCLEYIREYLMRRIVTVQELMKKCIGPLTPNATKILDIMKEKATAYKAVWNGDKKFEVSEPWGDQCVVDIEWKHCSCRKWQLRGIPCVHAVATNRKMALGGDRVESIESWVHPVHRLDTWRHMYAFKVQPINGCIMWPKTQTPTTILPPKHHTPVGRPKKNRRKTADEKASMVKGSQLSGAGRSVRCDKCKKLGHNQRTCKGQVEKTGGKKRKGKEAAGKGNGASSSGGKEKAPARKKRKVTATLKGDPSV